MTDWIPPYKFPPHWEDEEFLGQRCFRKDSNTAQLDWKSTYSFWQDAIRSYCEQRAKNMVSSGSKLTFTCKDLSAQFVTKVGLKPACLDQVLAEMYERKVVCTSWEWETRPSSFFSSIAFTLTSYFSSPSCIEPDNIMVYRDVAMKILKTVHYRIVQLFTEDRADDACILAQKDLHLLLRENWRNFTRFDIHLVLIGLEKQKLLVTHKYLQTTMCKVSMNFASSVTPIAETDKRSMLKCALSLQIRKLQKTKEKDIEELERLRKRAKRLNQSTPVRRAGGKIALEGRHGALLKMVLRRITKKRMVIEDIEGKELNLTLVRDTLEQQDSNVEVLESLQKASVMLKERNDSITAEQVEEHMDKMQQELQRAGRLDHALSTPIRITDIDDEALLELEALQAEQIAEQLGQIGKVPVHEPNMKAEEEKSTLTPRKENILCT